MSYVKSIEHLIKQVVKEIRNTFIIKTGITNN